MGNVGIWAGTQILSSLARSIGNLTLSPIQAKSPCGNTVALVWAMLQPVGNFWLLDVSL